MALHGASDFAGGVRKPPFCMGPTTSLQIDRARNPSACAMVLHDLLPYLLEWCCMLVLLLIYLACVHLIPVPGCATGYSGPGGTHGEYGRYMHGTCSGGTWPEHCCTGGATGYIDWLIFGGHTALKDSATPALRMPGTLYGAGPLSRYSVLGTLPSCLVAYLGLQAGRVFCHFREEGHEQVIVRWVLWSGLCGGAAALLHLTVMPISPALNNISFVLAAVCVWQGCFVVMYTVVDVLRFGRGSSPMFLRCMGANSLPVYVTCTLLPDLFRYPYGGTNDVLLLMREVCNVAGFSLLAALFWLHRFFPRV